MSSAIHYSQLRQFLPLSTFPKAQLIELASAARIAEPADHSPIFDAAHPPHDELLYLLAGEATAVTHTGVAAIIEAGSPGAAYALNDGRFQSVTAFADVVLARLPFDLVDLLATWDQLAVVERRSIERSVDFFSRGIPRRWRYAFFQVLRSTPPARIEELMQSFAPLVVQERQVLAHQGEPAYEFFVIDSGAALVTREIPTEEGESIELAELNDGESFGAEAFSHAPYYSATVSMISDGVLMHLSRSEFLRLQEPPRQVLLRGAEAVAVISNGGHWLDVRQREGVRIFV